jgi:hypothetical protein
MAGVHLCIGSLLSDRAMIHLEYSQGQDRSGLIPVRAANSKVKLRASTDAQRMVAREFGV